MSKFQRAERKRVKLKIGITGPSGSGKTYSALAMATGIGEKIALVDTERDSASLYSDRFTFDALNIEPPYTIPKYIDAMKAAEAEGYDVCIVDSLSHAWAGDGGILSKKAAMDSRGGNSFTNWGQLTPEQERLVATILSLNIHLICTLRSKQEYVLETNDKGKQVPRKVGMSPIQRDGMEYEFTTVFDAGMDHQVSVSKDRTNLFGGQYFQIDKSTGQKLIDWLNGAKIEAPKPQPPAASAPPQAEPQASPNGTISEKQRKRLFAIAKDVPDAEMKSLLKEYGYESSKDIKWQDYEKICNRVTNMKRETVAS